MNPQDIIGEYAKEMLAYCYHLQGRSEDALRCLSDSQRSSNTPARSLLIGQIHAQQGRWEDAVDQWQNISADLCGQNGLHRIGSDCLMAAAIQFSERSQWEKVMQCMEASRSLCADNPLLDNVSGSLKTSLPFILFESKNYGKAIDHWVEELRSNGYDPQTVHLLGIAHLSVLEAKEALPSEREMATLEQAFMFWSALAVDTNYWAQIYDTRRPTYGNGIGYEHFVGEVAALGLNRCERLLGQLQQELESKNDLESLELIEALRVRMEIERHSARLIDEVSRSKGLNWPKGGFGMLSIFWGSEEAGKRLESIVDSEPGSCGWLLKGLLGKSSSQPFVSYLNGDWGQCLDRIEKETTDRDLGILMGLSLVRKAENALQFQQLTGCREFAERFLHVPDPKIRERAEELLTDLASLRVQVFINRDETDKAVEFLVDVTEKARAQRAWTEKHLINVRENLSSLLLKRGEAKYDTGDLEGWLRDYDAALKYAPDKGLCEREFQKIVRYHVNQLYKKNNNCHDALLFVESLSKRYPSSSFLKAQRCFLTALKLLHNGRPIDSTSVLEQLENAYRADSSDTEIASALSRSLSNKAVSTLNEVNRYSSPSTMRSALRESETLLGRALQLDSGNDHARDSLTQLLDLKRQLGIYL